ncbi:MAG: aminotransferase class V-fold PLP-dependent enzyme [Chitinispirillales bacterium]|nr:aminotransferase class V-fold PLP-dependent enzyme [Chitinispirillales bacterium]
MRPLAYLEDNKKIRTAFAPLNKEMRLDEEAYNNLLRQKPRLVVMSHGSNVTGCINPVSRLFKAAKSAGAVTILDANQTAGRHPVLCTRLWGYGAAP